MSERTVYIDVSPEQIKELAGAFEKEYPDRVLVLAPLGGKISVNAPSKTGKQKGYHRFKFEAWIPESAIEGESAIVDFGALLLMGLPKYRIKHPF